MIPIIAKLIAKANDSNLAMFFLPKVVKSPVPDTQHGACQLRVAADLRAFRESGHCGIPHYPVHFRTGLSGIARAAAAWHEIDCYVCGRHKQGRGEPK
jgi:hypothetical protein